MPVIPWPLEADLDVLLRGIGMHHVNLGSPDEQRVNVELRQALQSEWPVTELEARFSYSRHISNSVKHISVLVFLFLRQFRGDAELIVQLLDLCKPSVTACLYADGGKQTSLLSFLASSPHHFSGSPSRSASRRSDESPQMYERVLRALLRIFDADSLDTFGVPALRIAELASNQEFLDVCRPPYRDLIARRALKDSQLAQQESSETVSGPSFLFTAWFDAIQKQTQPDESVCCLMGSSVRVLRPLLEGLLGSRFLELDLETSRERFDTETVSHFARFLHSGRFAFSSTVQAHVLSSKVKRLANWLLRSVDEGPAQVLQMAVDLCDVIELEYASPDVRFTRDVEFHLAKQASEVLIQLNNFDLQLQQMMSKIRDGSISFGASFELRSDSQRHHGAELRCRPSCDVPVGHYAYADPPTAVRLPNFVMSLIPYFESLLRFSGPGQSSGNHELPVIEVPFSSHVLSYFRMFIFEGAKSLGHKSGLLNRASLLMELYLLAKHAMLINVPPREDSGAATALDDISAATMLEPFLPLECGNVFERFDVPDFDQRVMAANNTWQRVMAANNTWRPAEVREKVTPTLRRQVETPFASLSDECFRWLFEEPQLNDSPDMSVLDSIIEAWRVLSWCFCNAEELMFTELQERLEQHLQSYTALILQSQTNFRSSMCLSRDAFLRLLGLMSSAINDSRDTRRAGRMVFYLGASAECPVRDDLDLRRDAMLRVLRWALSWIFLGRAETEPPCLSLAESEVSYALPSVSVLDDVLRDLSTGDDFTSAILGDSLSDLELAAVLISSGLFCRRIVEHASPMIDEEVLGRFIVFHDSDEIGVGAGLSVPLSAGGCTRATPCSQCSFVCAACTSSPTNHGCTGCVVGQCQRFTRFFHDFRRRQGGYAVER